MIVNVFPNADPPYGLVEGIRSDRTLSIFLRAVPSWYAFGWYDHLIVDLTSFNDWSSRVVDLGRIHGYPDRAHAQQAMQENRIAQKTARRQRIEHTWRKIARTPLTH